MTIFWTFFNIPRGEEYFEAQLQPSVGDFIFSFNLGVCTPGDDNWKKASREYVPGRETHNLKIAGNPNQELFLFVKDKKGIEKRLNYQVNERWASDGDVGSTSEVADYKKYFLDSLGISEECMYCEALFEEYKNLKTRTRADAQNLEPGQPYEVPHINPQDLIQRKVLAKELLKKCEDCFKNKLREWHDLEIDAAD